MQKITKQKNTVAFRLTDENRESINALIDTLGENNDVKHTQLFNDLLKKAFANPQTQEPIGASNEIKALRQQLENLNRFHRLTVDDLQQKQSEEIAAINKSHAEETELIHLNMDKMQAYVLSALNLNDEQAAEYENWKNNQLLPSLRELTSWPDLELTGQEIFSLLLDYAQTDPVAELLNILQLTPKQTDLIENLRFPRAQAFETIFLTKIQNYEQRDQTEAGGAEVSEGAGSSQQTGTEANSQESSQEEGSEEEIGSTTEIAEV